MAQAAKMAKPRYPESAEASVAKNRVRVDSAISPALLAYNSGLLGGGEPYATIKGSWIITSGWTGFIDSSATRGTSVDFHLQVVPYDDADGGKAQGGGAEEGGAQAEDGGAHGEDADEEEEEEVAEAEVAPSHDFHRYMKVSVPKEHLEALVNQVKTLQESRTVIESGVVKLTALPATTGFFANQRSPHNTVLTLSLTQLFKIQVKADAKKLTSEKFTELIYRRTLFSNMADATPGKSILQMSSFVATIQQKVNFAYVVTDGVNLKAVSNGTYKKHVFGHMDLGATYAFVNARAVARDDHEDDAPFHYEIYITPILLVKPDGTKVVEAEWLSHNENQKYAGDDTAKEVFEKMRQRESQHIEVTFEDLAENDYKALSSKLVPAKFKDFKAGKVAIDVTIVGCKMHGAAGDSMGPNKVYGVCITCGKKINKVVEGQQIWGCEEGCPQNKREKVASLKPIDPAATPIQLEIAPNAKAVCMLTVLLKPKSENSKSKAPSLRVTAFESEAVELFDPQAFDDGMESIRAWHLSLAHKIYNNTAQDYLMTNIPNGVSGDFDVRIKLSKPKAWVAGQPLMYSMTMTGMHNVMQIPNPEPKVANPSKRNRKDDDEDGDAV